MSQQTNFFKNKVAVVSGASRGIGEAIAISLAEAGTHVVLLGKTKDPHPKLTGTLSEVKAKIDPLGVKCLAIQCDVRKDEDVAQALQEVSGEFPQVDFLINNAGSVQVTSTTQTEMKRFDLMMGINLRGSFLMTQTFLPLLKKSESPRILNISPPISFKPQWLAPHLPYTLSKYALSTMTMGWAAEFHKEKILVNSLWPKTLIETAAMALFSFVNIEKDCRYPTIVADAAKAILEGSETGKLWLDEDVLKAKGVNDFSKYQRADANPKPDLYVDGF